MARDDSAPVRNIPQSVAAPIPASMPGSMPASIPASLPASVPASMPASVPPPSGRMDSDLGLKLWITPFPFYSNNYCFSRDLHTLICSLYNND